MKYTPFNKKPFYKRYWINFKISLMKINRNTHGFLPIILLIFAVLIIMLINESGLLTDRPEPIVYCNRGCFWNA